MQTTLECGPVPLNGVAGNAFLYADAGDKGYYRTDYSAGAVEGDRGECGDAADAAGADWAAGRRVGADAGGRRGSVGEFLDLVLAVKQDPNATVLESALGKVGAIGAQIATDEDRKRLDGVVRREFGPVYAALGRAESMSRATTRTCARRCLMALGRAEDPAVLAEAENMTKQLFAGQKPADPAVVDAAVGAGDGEGRRGDVREDAAGGRKATDPDLKEAALHALTRFQSPELVMRTLEYAVSDEVRNQDSWTLITPLLARRATQDLAWAFVEQHWAEIERKATESSGARIVEAAGAFCTAERRDEVASFFAAHPVRVGRSGRWRSRSTVSTTASNCGRRRSRSCGRGWTRTRGSRARLRSGHIAHLCSIGLPFSLYYS